MKQTKRPDIIALYVRQEIQRREHIEPRGWMQQIEDESGLTRGHVTRIKNDHSDVFTLKQQTVNALLPALGFDDYGEFLLAVAQWWKESGRALFEQFEAPERIDDLELREAVEMAKPWAPRGVIIETMKQFEASKGHEDRWWWVQRITEKAKQHTFALGSERAEKRSRKSQQDRLTRARKDAPESTRDLAGAMPRKKTPPTESPATPSVHKKTSNE